jgi:hypothetical protein
MSASHRFTATLRRPQGSRVIKGTMNRCHGLDNALIVVRELLRSHDAFEENVTSLKITISPIRRKTKHQHTHD